MSKIITLFCKPMKRNPLEQKEAGFSLGRLHMGGICPPPYGGQVQGDKVLMGGTHKGGHRPYGGT